MKDLRRYLKSFVYADEGGKQQTAVHFFSAGAGMKIPVYTNEFWTSRQRQASSLHEVSYRACFKPQLPRFFIELLTRPGDIVFDPFSGRGTTALEAALLGRNVAANDVNPLSRILCEPRLHLPDIDLLKKRLDEIEINYRQKSDIDLSMFFEKKTLAEILSLRSYLFEREANGLYDETDAWIRMVATNRLTGHSPGFFSVYTLPPNQAASPARQKKINADKKQKPVYRNTKHIIVKKSLQLLKGVSEKQRQALSGCQSKFLTGDAAKLETLKPNTVQLTVTSPPFLDVVQYAADNWMRCWFNHIDAEAVQRGITMAKTVDSWNLKMLQVFKELHRITLPGGFVAFEVGEVRNGKIKLEEEVIHLGSQAGFVCEAVMINSQSFTKTSNIWKVDNNSKGTNTNRIVIFRK